MSDTCWSVLYGRKRFGRVTYQCNLFSNELSARRFKDSLDWTWAATIKNVKIHD